MPRVLFTQNAELKQGDGKGPKFAAGQVYDLVPDQAERWKRRGVAVDAPPEPEPAKVAAPVETRAPKQRAAKLTTAQLAPDGVGPNLAGLRTASLPRDEV